MKTKIYDHITAPAPRYLLRLSVIIDILKKNRIDSREIVEIGPGSGDLLSYLALIYPNSIVTGVETSKTALQLLHKRFNNHKSISLTDKLDTSTSTLTLCFEVLEHIEDDISFLNDISNSMTPGATLILSVPAYMRKWQKQDDWAGHVRRYEKQELIEKITSQHYKIVDTYDYGFPLMNILKPIKQLYYNENQTINQKEKTEKSGIDRGKIKKVNPKVAFFLALPFSTFQKLFYKTNLGDGIVVVAQKL